MPVAQWVSVLTFAVGLIIGVAFGVMVVGFLAVTAFQRGYDEALFRRREWRAELVARRKAEHAVPVAAIRKAG